MVFVELACCRIVAIALFGNGQREDVDGGIGNRRDDGGGIFGRDENLGDRSCKVQSLTRGAPFDPREEAGLRRKLIPNSRRAQRDAPDPPVAAFERKDVVDICRLVGPVECADAKVEDANAMLRGPVGGRFDRPPKKVGRSCRQASAHSL